MANVILPEQTFEGYFNNDGIYMGPMAVIALEQGKTYSVFWDGTEYKCTADTVVFNGAEVTGVGNLAIAGVGENTGEPFLIGIMADGSGAATYTTDTAASHTVAIYTADTGFVLKDRTGKAETYDVDVVRFQTPDGSTQTFAKGEIVTEVPIVLDFSEGDQTINAAAGTLVKSAVIQKPINLVPENIAKDVDVAGIVGTHEGGGSGGGIPMFYEPDWIDDVCFWDYDGTLIMQLSVAEAKNLKELPTPPEHEGLVFQEWNYTLEEVQAAEYPYDIGAVYATSDGNTHLTLSVTNSSYRAVPIHFSQDAANGVTISWGDGSTSVSDGTVGATSLTHTYSKNGTYKVVISVADGCTMTLSGGTGSTSFVGGNTSNYRDYATALHIGNNVVLGTYCLYFLRYLAALTIPNGSITEPPKYACSYLYSLSALIIPRSCVSIAEYACSNASGDYVRRTETIFSIPPTITSLGTYALTSCSYTPRFSLPPSITVIPDGCFNNAHKATRLFMSDKVTSIGNMGIQSAEFISRFKLPDSVVTIGNYFLNNTGRIDELVLPDADITIGNNFLYGSSIKRLIVKGTVSSVGNYPLKNCYGLDAVIFYQETPTAAMGELLGQLSLYVNIYVPDGSVAAYQAVAASSYDYAIRPLSEYPLELPE